MKIFIVFIFTLMSLQAQGFTKEDILGEWELSSSKLNRFIAFGTYIGTTRNESLTLLFSPRGKVKVLETGDVYNYELITGLIKIYQIKKYGKNTYIKRKKYYDVLQSFGDYEGCKKVKVVTKKIPGYKSKHLYKMCKISDYPQPTYQESISKYKF